MDFTNSLVPFFEATGVYAYLLVALLSFLESTAIVGFFIPGGPAIIILGFMAGQGYLDLTSLTIAASIGAILGDSFSYWLGTKGTKFFREENKLLKKSHLERGKAFFSRHGSKSVLLGRFTPIKPMIPFIAGISKMAIGKFMLWNVVSGIIWASFHSLFGYLIGGTLSVVEAWSTRVGYFLAIAFLVALVIWLLIKYSHYGFSFSKSLLISIGQAIAANPDVKKLVARFPGFFGFLRRRLDIKTFYGLPLTIFSIVFVYLASLFGGVVEGVLKSAPIAQADIRVENLLYAFRDETIAGVFFWLTMLGQTGVAIIAASAAVIGLWLYGKRIYAFALWLTLGGSALTTFLAKMIVHRPRPGGSIPLFIEHSYSFPSGHATAAIALYGFLTYFFLRNIRQWRYKLNIAFAAVLTVIAIGFSRLYLGVHYLSDVLGGYLIGLIWLIVGITFVEWLIGRRKGEELTVFKGRKATAWFVAAGFAAIYIVASIHYRPPFIFQPPAGPIYRVVHGNIAEIFAGDNLTKYTEGIVGQDREPLSFIIAAKNDADIRATFSASGWHEADPVTFQSIYKIALKMAADEPYPAGPMTPSFWNNAVNDFNFEKPTAANTIRQRHHARFWKTNFATPDGYKIYVGTASYDRGVKWLITHAISPDLDTEREFLFQDLVSSGRIAEYSREQFTPPNLGTNFAGDQFFTDGELYKLRLK